MPALRARIAVQEVVGSTLGAKGEVHWLVRIDGPEDAVKKAFTDAYDMAPDDPLSVSNVKGGGVQMTYVTSESDFLAALEMFRAYIDSAYHPNTVAGRGVGEDPRDPDDTPHVVVLWSQHSEPFEGSDGEKHVEYHSSIQIGAEAATIEQATEMIRPLNQVLKTCGARSQMWAIPAVHSSRRMVVRVGTFALAVEDNLKDCIEALKEASSEAEFIEIPPNATGPDWNVDLYAKGHTPGDWGNWQAKRKASKAEQTAKIGRERERAAREIQRIVDRLAGKKTGEFA